MNVLLGVIALFAILSLVAAAIQAAAMVRLAPAGEKLGSFMFLGWWKFGQLEAKAGPAAAQNLNIYKRAVIAFLVFVVLGITLSGWAINQRPAATTVSLINDPRVIPADFAFNIDLRRVATMPGAPILES
jgi:protein-S-isoprenylcysteine O-methyltransferase Ste14